MNKSKIEKFLTSEKEVLIRDRFLVKASKLNTGNHPISILLVIRDVVGDNFKVKFFSSEATATDFLHLLNQV